jgi:transcriptional regulator with XRE-family HTH domain
MSITSQQCRGARAMLGLSQADLEAASRVAKKSIADFEREATKPQPRTLDALQAALENGGVEFIPENGGGPGVRLRARLTPA